MSNVTILGSGRVAGALAAKCAAVGHSVAIGSRDPVEARTRWHGPEVEFARHSAAIRRAEIVINATPGDTSLQRLTELRSDLDGKILIDVSNATERSGDGLPGNLLYPNSSLAEHLQDALPGTAVVKTLNTMLFTVMVDPRALSVPPTAFLSGNDRGAKASVSQLLQELGWPSDWIEDLGDITTARGPEALMLLVPHILRIRGLRPFALTVAK